MDFDLFSWSWLTLVMLGSFHGLNPAMGWLFAVGLGLQERRTSAVTRALAPIALGHALSIGVVAMVAWMLGRFLPQDVLLAAGGAVMLGFAARKVVTRFRHPRWVGMQLGARDLVAWSFVMATAHGAGLMLLPPLLALRASEAPAAAAHAGHQADLTAHSGHAGHGAAIAGDGLGVSLLAVGVHTLALLLVTGAVALLVYRKLGVDILRRAWINVDVLWVGAMGIAGAGTMLVGLWSLVFG